jgi:branched-chain amino acid transport system ATP-binding protein
MSELLKVTALSSGYGPVQILRDVHLTLHPGELVALLGSNGAGKTTLNHTLCGLVRAHSGQVLFNGQDLTQAHYSDVVRAGLVQVPEGRKIFPNMNVLDNLLLGAYTLPHALRPDLLERVLKTFPRLAERLTQMAGTLSGGEQQMLAIGRGLMASPKLLILDEPSLGLSPKLVQEMFDLIVQLKEEGLTILLVEQNVGQSLDVASRAYVLENGQIRFSGSPGDLLASDVMRQAYLGA